MSLTVTKQTCWKWSFELGINLNSPRRFYAVLCHPIYSTSEVFPNQNIFWIISICWIKKRILLDFFHIFFSKTSSWILQNYFFFWVARSTDIISQSLLSLTTLIKKKFRLEKQLDWPNQYSSTEVSSNDKFIPMQNFKSFMEDGNKFFPRLDCYKARRKQGDLLFLKEKLCTLTPSFIRDAKSSGNYLISYRVRIFIRFVAGTNYIFLKLPTRFKTGYDAIKYY